MRGWRENGQRKCLSQYNNRKTGTFFVLVYPEAMLLLCTGQEHTISEAKMLFVTMDTPIHITFDIDRLRYDVMFVFENGFHLWYSPVVLDNKRKN